MKRINIEDMNRRNDYMIDDFMRGVLSMEFIKVGDKYLLKGSNSVIVDEEEKLKLERNEMIADNGDCGCEVEKIKKVSKINKKLKEIVDNGKKISEAVESGKPIIGTGKPIIEVADDTIEETNSTL